MRQSSRSRSVLLLWGVLVIALAIVGVLAFRGISAPVGTLGVGERETNSLQIGQYTANVEIASTAQERSLGLMFRDSLAPDSGMLFIWPEDTQSSFWMANTNIPLSIAFITAHGVIIQIADRADTRSTEQTFAEQPFRYALEMNLGWFAERDIQVGMTVTFPPTLHQNQ